MSYLILFYVNFNCVLNAYADVVLVFLYKNKWLFYLNASTLDIIPKKFKLEIN